MDEFMDINRRKRVIALQSAVGGMAFSLIGMLFAATSKCETLFEYHRRSVFIDQLLDGAEELGCEVHPESERQRANFGNPKQSNVRMAAIAA